MSNVNNKRMTPKQREMFLSVAECWGEVFEVYSSYSFLIDAGVVQRASAEQVADHYQQLSVNLQGFSAAIHAAVDAGDFARAKELADDAHFTQQQILERAEDAPKLATLSARGRELADKYIAIRDAQRAADARLEAAQVSE